MKRKLVVSAVTWMNLNCYAEHKEPDTQSMSLSVWNTRTSKINPWWQNSNGGCPGGDEEKYGDWLRRGTGEISFCPFFSTCKFRGPGARWTGLLHRETCVTVVYCTDRPITQVLTQHPFAIVPDALRGISSVTKMFYFFIRAVVICLYVFVKMH